MIAAGSGASELNFSSHETSKTENGILQKYNLWNCATCKLAFDGVNQLIESNMF